MIKTIVIFGEVSVNEYEETGKIPSDSFVEEAGNIIEEKVFNNIKEYEQYGQGLIDAEGWGKTLMLRPEILNDEIDLVKDTLASIKIEIIDMIKKEVLKHGGEIGSMEDPLRFEVVYRYCDECCLDKICRVYIKEDIVMVDMEYDEGFEISNFSVETLVELVEVIM